MDELLLASCLAFAFTIILILALSEWASRLKLLDVPGGRKCHEAPTPLVGGLAITLASLPLIGWQWVMGTVEPWFWACIVLLCLVGVFDDREEISPNWRLVTQMVAGLVMIFAADLVLSTLGDLASLGTISLGVFAVPVTLFAVLSAINAFNMSDGLDGLAGGLLLIPLAAITILAANASYLPQAMVGATFSVGVAAFLLFNYPFPWSPGAKIFLGDTGSTVLGFVIAWLLIDLSQLSVIHPVTAVYLIAIPLLDIAAVIVRRLRKGASLSAPGRDHLHHILQDAGLSVKNTVLAIHSGALFIAVLGLSFFKMKAPDSVAFFVFILILFSYVFLTRSQHVTRNWLAARIK